MTTESKPAGSTLNRRVILASTPVAALALGGCLESPEVTVHEPGKYKGKDDPLLAQQVASREQQLQKRFQDVQVDR